MEDIEVVKNDTGKKVKKVFDRIWSTAMIIINTAFGILLAAYAFAALGDDIFCRWHWQGVLIAMVAMIGVNISNFVIRRMIKNY